MNMNGFQLSFFFSFKQWISTWINKQVLRSKSIWCSHSLLFLFHFLVEQVDQSDHYMLIKRKWDKLGSNMNELTVVQDLLGLHLVSQARVPRLQLVCQWILFYLDNFGLATHWSDLLKKQSWHVIFAISFRNLLPLMPNQTATAFEACHLPVGRPTDSYSSLDFYHDVCGAHWSLKTVGLGLWEPNLSI